MLTELFCPKSENFLPVVQKFIKVFGIRKKIVFSSKKTSGLEKHSFYDSLENLQQNVWTFRSMSKNGNENVSGKKFLRGDFHPDK